MSFALLLNLQAAASAAASTPEPVDFDLARYRQAPVEGCGARSAGEIVVCGRRLNREIDPDGRLARRYVEHPLKAEIRVGGGAVASAAVSSAPMPRGAVSNRIMIGIKLPF